jgi:hypothetical protein
MTEILVDERVSDPEQQTDEPIHSHIIERPADGRDAEVVIMEARVNGTPVTALCGYVWVPNRDPQKYPLCSKCEELFEFAQDLRS